MRYKAEDVREVRQRLKEGKLSSEDLQFLDELASRYEKAFESESVEGRPIIARLPYGMDVIK